MRMDQGKWLNPPPVAEVSGERLRVVTAEESDFWRETFYGFVHDNGHALLHPAGAEFSAEVRFEADYAAQYDQAGLMIRADAKHWIKAGIEYVGGTPHLAVVVTNGTSDWSQMPLPGALGAMDLRVTRIGGAVWVQYRKPRQDWTMLRLAAFPERLPVSVGPMCCSPSRAGLEVRFEAFSLGPPASRKPY